MHFNTKHHFDLFHCCYCPPRACTFMTRVCNCDDIELSFCCHPDCNNILALKSKIYVLWGLLFVCLFSFSNNRDRICRMKEMQQSLCQGNEKSLKRQTKQTPIISSNSYLSALVQTNKQKTSSNISATDLAVCQTGVTLRIEGRTYKCNCLLYKIPYILSRVDIPL